MTSSVTHLCLFLETFLCNFLKGWFFKELAAHSLSYKREGRVSCSTSLRYTMLGFRAERRVSTARTAAAVDAPETAI